MTNLLFETVGQQAKKAAVIVGRFNPPTIGHYALFKAVKAWMKDNADLNLHPVPIVVVVQGKNTSKDKARNPLDAKDRISAMIGSKKADGFNFLIAPSAFDAFEEVRKAGFEPIAIATGTDREGQYLKMLDQYFTTKDGGKIKHHEIKLERDVDGQHQGTENLDKEAALDDILKYVDKDIPINMVSGSLARRAVERGELNKFAVLVGIEDLAAAKIIFNKVKKSLDDAKIEADKKAADKAAKKEKTNGAT